MALYDLYSPRIAVEQRDREAGITNAVRSLLGMAEVGTDWAKSKMYTDAAFGEAVIRAETERMKQKMDELKLKDEGRARRWNMAVVGAGVLPPEQWTPEMENEMQNAFFDVSGFKFPTDAQGRIIKTPDVVERLRMAIVDEKGQLTPQALSFLADSTKSVTDMGKIIDDIGKLRAKGLAYNSPEITLLMKEAIHRVATSLDSQTGRYIQHVYDTQGPEAAFAKIKELRLAGASKTGDIKVTIPGEGERKEVSMARGTLQMLHDIRNLYQGMRANNEWTVGPGVETGQTLASFLPKLNNPRSKELFATVNKVQSDMLRIAAGLAQTDPEIKRQQGYVIRGDLSPANFETALDLNIKWAERHLNNMISGMGDYSQKAPVIPELKNPPSSSASDENNTDTRSEVDVLRQQLNDVNKKIEMLQKRRNAAGVSP